MTNGEKILNAFPNATTRVWKNKGFTYIEVEQNDKWIADFDMDWWNAEYKEPSKSEIPTGSTTKNNLGVDCISRDEVCRYVAEFVNYEFSTREEEELIDNIITGIECMPSVTPQEPKAGHWKLVQRGKEVDICCSKCEATRVKGYVYNYTIDQLKEDLKEYLKNDDMSYCPYCGSDNREVEE